MRWRPVDGRVSGVDCKGRSSSSLPAPTANTPAIVLMTDGLQNTPPMIADVEGTLGQTRLCIVGFGGTGDLDGPLLTRLAESHNGLYTRAGEGLSLKKFFVLCFGNIFQTGISLDPAYRLEAGATEATPIPFGVCGEDTITVVVGWQHPGADLSSRCRHQAEYPLRIRHQVSPPREVIPGPTPAPASLRRRTRRRVDGQGKPGAGKTRGGRTVAGRTLLRDDGGRWWTGDTATSNPALLHPATESILW